MKNLFELVFRQFSGGEFQFELPVEESGPQGVFDQQIIVKQG